MGLLFLLLCFFFNDTATTEIYTLSLHDALPISPIQNIFARIFLPRTNCAAMDHLPTTVARTVLTCMRAKPACPSPRLRLMDAISRCVNRLRRLLRNRSRSATKVSQVSRSRSIFQSSWNSRSSRRRRFLPLLRFPRPLLHCRNQPTLQLFFELGRDRNMKCCAGIDSQRFSFGCLENQLHRPVTRRSR